MVIGIAAKIAQLGARGLSLGGKAARSGTTQNFVGGLTGVGKGGIAGIAGYVAGTELLKHTVFNPLLGATGLYYSPQAPAPPPGGMSQQQMDFMYGRQGFSLPWQGQEAFMDRQLRTQREMFSEGQQTLRMANQNNFLLGTTAIAANERLGSRGLDTQLRIADLSTSRQLEGIRNTNQTRIGLADRELMGLRDTNRSRIKMADIGARRDMYVADRGVEVARWSGSPARIATFGALMRG